MCAFQFRGHLRKKQQFDFADLPKQHYLHEPEITIMKKSKVSFLAGMLFMLTASAALARPASSTKYRTKPAPNYNYTMPAITPTPAPTPQRAGSDRPSLVWNRALQQRQSAFVQRNHLV
jgi:hypothetical protein